MSNDFYNHGSFPTTGSAATSASMRAELDSIASGFDKMPVLTGNANNIVVVDGTGTTLTQIATLPATSGGTGLASYAVGDLLYASTTTALAKLADVATGNVLISGGVGAAPSWGKVGLTTHVTGTLPVANGGTGLTAGTSGGVLYYSATGTLASSAALAASALVVGGGAGVAPSTITTGTGVVTALGVAVGSAGAFVVNGGALGTPSSGTVTNLTGTASININGTVGATTPSTGAFTTLTVNTSGVISVSTSGDALRITQTGTGNALVVEDSANPDSTPFVIDALGRVVIAKATVQTTTNTGTPVLQSHVVGGNQIGLYGWSSTSSSPAQVRFLRSASGAIGTLGAVSDGFDLGAVQFFGDDGTDFVFAAQILAEVDGTPGTNDMPGRLVFSTTADGASTPTERMRIDSSGNVGIGTSSPSAPLTVSSAAATVDVARLYSGVDGAVQSETGIGFNSGTGSVNPAARISALEFDASDSRASLLFYTRDTNSDVAPTERMRIDSSGNVGIGTSSPANRLHVKGTWTPNEGQFQIDADSGQQFSGMTLQNNGTYKALFYNDNTNSLTFLTTASGSNQPLLFGINEAEAMRITTAGGISFGSSGTAYGTSGQALISAGNAAPVWTDQFLSITYIFSNIGASDQGDLTIPFNCTITEWTMLADVSGSAVIDIWKDTYANYPPTVADVITGSAKPTISASTKGQSSTLTGWTTTIAAGDTLRFNVDSASTLTRVTISLKVKRT